MDINHAIRSYSRQPLTHQLMLSILKEYKSPNDKLHSLINDGVLNPVKKGLYIAGLALGIDKPEPFLLANHIMGPSYVSLDAALAYYGMIPERVYGVSSVSVKSSRKFVTPMGLFTYTRLPLPYYSFGIKQEELPGGQYFMIASPEKALFDKILTTSGLTLRSITGTISYLTENLRIDEDALKGLDTEMMLSWLTDAPKKESLSMLIKSIKSIC